MEKTYQMTQELKDSISNFLVSYLGYEKCLTQLKEAEKREFSESEINLILNLLGSFPLRDVFHLVERFKVEVAETKNEDQEESQEGETEKN
jgi:hypothetical protein